MQKSFELSKLHKENSIDFVCNECGGAFQKPILATISSGGRVQTYYACPRCMARISKERKEITIPKEDVKKSSAKLNNVKCRHFLGYLKKRPKDVPTPDECLTCDKMIECLLS
jgi:tRNA(Ile2) C34 agmatinyltransferase TiaS